MCFKKICILIVVIHSFNVLGQGQANIWYFGENAGLDFNGGSPVAITTGQVNTDEGSAVISDAAGNLLFYTDGVTVWDKTHSVMSNGFGLNGSYTTTQSAVIIQKPGSANIYYIFTADVLINLISTKGIRYSEVDMSLNGGLGAVVAPQNILLKNPSCEKLAAVRQCNNQDFWVITHDYNSNSFSVFSVTSAGVNTIPVVSSAGLSTGSVFVNTLGQLKVSPDGKKLVTAANFSGKLELFDFNNSTGIVSNAVLLNTFPTNAAYGVEFSPDGTKLYMSQSVSRKIYQYDICAGSGIAIAASETEIGISDAFLGSLQLGPDKKIYAARWDGPWLGIINNPDIPGAGCNYVNNGISLGGNLSQLGLPNFISSYFKKPIDSFTSTVNCLTANFYSPTLCSGSPNPILSVLWDFNDPASGVNNTSTINNPNHIYSAADTYTVVLLVNYSCSTDTLKQNVIIGQSAISITTSVIPDTCDQSIGFATVAAIGGAGYYTYLWSNLETTPAISHLTSGTYTVLVTDADGCTSRSNAIITSISTVTITISPDITIISGDIAILSAAGGISYQWSPEAGLSCITCADPTASPQSTTVYCVTITDANACSDNVCVTVMVDANCGEVFVPTAFSPNNDRINDLLCMYNVNCIQSPTFRIYDRWGESVFETSNPEVCWDGVHKNKLMRNAIFYYIFEGSNLNGEKISKKGTIALIR